MEEIFIACRVVSNNSGIWFIHSGMKIIIFLIVKMHAGIRQHLKHASNNSAYAAAGDSRFPVKHEEVVFLRLGSFHIVRNGIFQNIRHGYLRFCDESALYLPAENRLCRLCAVAALSAAFRERDEGVRINKSVVHYCSPFARIRTILRSTIFSMPLSS